MPGYPSLPSGNIDAALASKPDSTTFEQHIYGASAPSASTAGFNFMKLQEQQALAHAQLQAAAGMATQRPGSANTAINTFDLFVSQQARDSSGLQQRRGSDASNFAPSSLGTVGATGNKKTNAMDLLNSPAAFTGPLPLPHQEGFRSSGVKQDQANGQSGDQDDGDLESSTRGWVTDLLLYTSRDSAKGYC